MSTAINPTHTWFVGGTGTDLIHSARQKKHCLDWIAEQHGITTYLGGTKYPTGGYLVEVGDTQYLVMPRDVAVVQGYRLDSTVVAGPLAAPAKKTTPAVAPKPGADLARGTARGGITDDGLHAYIEWRNTDGDHRTQTKPLADVDDLDTWLTRMASKIARYGITYTPRELTS